MPRIFWVLQNEGRSLRFGDTRPTAHVVPLSAGADVVVHEATFLHELASTAHEYYHSTARQAAEAAKEAGAKKLIMTHFSSRYKDEEQLQPLLSEASEIFSNTILAAEHELIQV